MLSTSKLIGVAALTALAATLVVTIPRESAPDPLPVAAPTENPPSTPISGKMTVLSQDEQGERGEYAYGRDYADEVWTALYDVDDPRLDGKSRSRHNRHTLPGTPYGSQTLSVWLENDGGSWIGDGYAYQDPNTSGIHYRLLLEGRDGYDGLAAIINLDQPGFSVRFDVTGAIIPGGLPQPAGPPPMELLPDPMEELLQSEEG